MPYLSPNKAPQLKGVIVGGGLAGLTFAKLLHERHPEVSWKIYERRLRLGGRVFTDRQRSRGATAQGDSYIERGAEFINGDHYRIIDWCKKLNVTLEASYNVEEGPPKFATIKKGQLRTDFKELITKLKEAVVRDREVIRRDPQVKKRLDHQAASDYIEALAITKDDMETLLLFLETEQGIRPKSMSASFMLEFMDFEQLEPDSNSLFIKGDDLYRISNGSSTLVDAMAKDLHNRIESERALKEITRAANGQYRVFIEGSSRAKLVDFVVLATPASAAANIKFDPSLRDIQRKLQSLTYSAVEKVIVEVSEDAAKVLDTYPELLSHEAKALVWKTGSTQRSQIAVYRGGANTNRVNVHSLRKLVKDLAAASSALDTQRREPPEVISAVTEMWLEGGYSQPMRGRGSDFNHGLKASPLDNFFIAGEHMAGGDPQTGGNPQTMEGAVESAESAFVSFEQNMLPRIKRTPKPNNPLK